MAKKRSEPKRLSDQLREIIRTCGLSRYAICKAAKIDPSQMHRFLRGTGRFTSDSLDRLAEVLRLRLVVDDEKATSRRKVGDRKDG